MTTTPRICIAGAGIGGLSAALALQARGLTATVLERSADPRPLGLGLNLLPHAVRELAALGLGPALADIAIAPHSIGFFDAQGTLLHRDPAASTAVTATRSCRYIAASWRCCSCRPSANGSAPLPYAPA